MKDTAAGTTVEEVPVTSGGVMVTTKGHLAYTLRAKGHKWSTVAKLAGCASADAAVAGAKKYAARKGVAWPLRVVTQVVVERQARQAQEERQQDEQDKVLYDQAVRGVPIAEIGNPSTVYAALDRYTARHGLPPIPRNGAKAYRLRTEESLPWGVIAKALGYRYANHATEAARRHAHANELEWPPSIRS